MYYSAIGLLAILILVIENNDILFKKQKLPVWRVYRRFLFVVIFYYFTDVLCGVFNCLKASDLLFADTLIYFIAMAIGVLFWTRFVVTYLQEKNVFGKILTYSGRILFGAVTILPVINIFTPVIFSIDDKCDYYAHTARYIVLISQIVLFVLLSVYAAASMFKVKDKSAKRYRTIALFGLIMAIFLTVQIWFPKIPLYSMAYMFGTCLLHTFVVNDEKEEYKKELQKEFSRMMEKPENDGQIIVSMGMSEYIDGTDNSFHDVFARADKQMYERKRELKARNK